MTVIEEKDIPEHLKENQKLHMISLNFFLRMSGMKP